jgi:hypothetical protein
LKFAAPAGYHGAMRPRLPSSLGKIALACAALVLGGCDTGGLLVVDTKDPPPVQGPSVNDIVSGGTFASNSRYRLFYTNGQPTPNQGVSTGDGTRLNGGLVGAAHGD